MVVGGLVAGLALVLFAGWRFLVYPQSVDYAAAVAQKQALAQQLQTARDTAAQFQKFKAQAEVMRRNLEFYNSRTDRPLNDVMVMQMFSDLGNQLGLGGWSVSVKDMPASTVAPGIAVYSVETKFNSDFDHLGRFMNACVDQRTIVVPSSVILKSVDDPIGLYNDTMTVDLTLLVYGGPAPKARF
jgi:Tfp pilus assembly protein PilO